MTANHPPTLLDHMRNILRLKHYSIRTEEAYVDWCRRYIYTHVLNRGPKAVRSPLDELILQ